MKTKYQFFEDPGHGWLKVTHAELKQLGIATEISEYSFMRGDYVYLEEDMDANTFYEAKKEKHLITIDYKINTSEKRSRIRGYDRYRPKGYITIIYPTRT